MGSIDIIKPLITTLRSAVNKSAQHQDKICRENWESNPGVLGEKRVCYICAMQPLLLTLWLQRMVKPCCSVAKWNRGSAKKFKTNHFEEDPRKPVSVFWRRRWRRRRCRRSRERGSVQQTRTWGVSLPTSSSPERGDETSESIFCISPFYPLSFSWSFSHTFLRRLASWLELSCRGGLTNDH